MKKNTVKRNYYNIHNVIWGIVLILAGVAFALNALGIANIDVFFKGWWTLFIIIPCAIGLVTSSDKSGNAAGLLLGVFLLLCARDILEYSMIWKLLLPAFVVMIGLNMLFGGLFGRKHRDDDDAFDVVFDDDNDDDNDDDENDDANSKDGNPPHTVDAIFSTHRLNYSGKVFHSANINVIFGGAQLDLRNSIIEEDCKIRTGCIFGGITILVPENVNVRVQGSGIFGGVFDKTEHCENAPIIYIKSNFIFGGVTVR